MNLSGPIALGNWFSIDSNWALVLLTLVLAIATLYYALEAGRQRRSADRTLAELRSQKEKSLDTHIVISQWDHNDKIEIMNLGPGPTGRFEIRAAYGSNNKTHAGMSYGIGIPIGGTRWVAFATSWFNDPLLQEEQSEGHMAARIFAWTMDGREMPSYVQNISPISYFGDTRGVLSARTDISK